MHSASAGADRQKAEPAAARKVVQAAQLHCVCPCTRGLQSLLSAETQGLREGLAEPTELNVHRRHSATA